MSAAAARPRVIINPLSFRASRRGLAGRVAAAARGHGLPVLLASDPGAFHEVLEQLRAQQVEQIWMLAGDGTVQATAQYLAQPQCRGWAPALLLLGGGRANLVPREMGGYPAARSLAAAFEKQRAGEGLREEQLLTLRVEHAGAEPRHGFFLAAAAVYAGIRLCREHRARGAGWLHRSWIADPYVLLKLAAQVWMGRSPLPSYDDLQVRVDGTLAMRASMRLLLASTLQMREALYNPFAARGEGPVRLTAVAADARHFWRRLPAISRGRFDEGMNVQQGYLSGRSGAVEITGLDGYALDGELFAVDPSVPVRLSGGIAIRVLRP